MAIFNNSGSGVLLNYDVIFREKPYEDNELSTLNNSNHIIQIDTNLNNVPVLDEKKALPTPTLIKTYDKASNTAKNFGRIAGYEHNRTYGYIYDKNTSKNGVFYLEIAKNKVKDTLADINITIPALKSATTASNIDSEWIVLYSNSKPGQTTLGYEIKKVSLTDPATTQNTITVTASELLEKTNVDKTAASYVILSSNTTFSDFSKIALKYTGGTVTKATTLTEEKAIKAATNTIVYLSANYKVKYIPLSSKHIYKCINYAECSVPRFLLYNSIPAESMIGEPLNWIEGIQGGMWEVPGKKGETRYLAYSYKETGEEPIIEDYTLEYYLPKLYANKSNNWEYVSNWFKIPHVDENNFPLLTYYNNNPDAASLSLEHIKNYSANKKVYYLENEEYIELKELPKIHFTEEAFNNNNLAEDKDKKTVLQTINGIDTKVDNLSNWDSSYYYYEPIQIYYNPIIINDWFNENCINTWEFSSTEPYYNISQNQQAYSITNLNKKTYWFQTGNNYQDQEFNAIKSELNPINTAIITISCYFDINPIIDNIGGTQILKDGNIELIQLYFNGYIYKRENNTYIRKNISRNVENVTSISSLLEGKLTTITDKNTETLRPYAFYQYSNLEYADFPNCTNIEYGGGSTYTTAPFQGCTNLNTLKFPKWNYPYYTTISKSYCVTGSTAAKNKSPFRGLNKLSEINYGVLSLPNAAITNNAITSTNFIFYDSLINNALTKMTISSCSIIGNYNFYKTNLNNVVLGNNIPITIGDYAFANCVNLKNINLNQVTLLGTAAFANCTTMYSVMGLSNIQTVGEGAFSNCTSLAQLGQMESTAITIKPKAFLNCTSLEEVDAIGCGLFGAENKAFVWNYGTASKPAYSNPIENCSNLQILKLGVNDNIPNGFFNDATRKISNLTTIAFPNVTSIASSAFKDLSFLENALINVDTIENNVFENCSIKHINENENEGLYDLNISKIGDRAFATEVGKGVLENINLTKEWEDKTIGIELGENAFLNAPLKKISISQLHPNTILVTTNGAFTKNSGDNAWSSYVLDYLKLNNIKFKFSDLQTNESINSLQYFEADQLDDIDGFRNYISLITLNCPKATKILTDGLSGLTQNNDDKININIPLEEDIDYSKLKIFNMPEINTIGENAFKDTKINTAFFSKLTTINSSAFENTGISNIYCVVNENGQLKYTYPDSNEIQSQLINLSILEGFDDNGSPILNLNKNTLYIQLNEINEPISIGQNAFREDIVDSAENKMNLYLSPNLKINQGAFYNRRIQSLYFTNDLIDSNDEDYIANLEISTGAFYNCIFEDDEATKRLKIQLPSGQGHFKINENAFFFIDSENLPEEIIVIVNDVDLEDSTSNYYLHPKAFQKNGTEIEFSIKIDNSNEDTKNKIIEQCNKYDHISIIE